MTVLTDAALGALCSVLAARLFRSKPNVSQRCWAAALAICALSAFAGGAYHGFLPQMPSSVSEPLWTLTLMSIGWAAFFAVVAISAAYLPKRWRRVVATVAAVQLAVYLYAATQTAEFIIAILDYSVSFGFVLAVCAYAWIAASDIAARWIVLGVVVSFLAAGIQATGIAPHPHFNHNDLYHVVQMLGMWMLYKGASGMVDRP